MVMAKRSSMLGVLAPALVVVLARLSATVGGPRRRDRRRDIMVPSPGSWPRLPAITFNNAFYWAIGFTLSALVPAFCCPADQGTEIGLVGFTASPPVEK
ncbi:MAG TPA: hypothetical protein VMF65_21135 [Acidimicrobiales bacterium]|nr:hypothetical protein [Acidimicrobiales bacterium]